MPLLSAKSRPCECSFRYSTQDRSQREAGWAKTLHGNALASLPTVQLVSPYFRNIFLLILVKKTKGCYPKFHVFFLPDNGENQTKEGLHRKFNAFVGVIFIFRGRLFPFLSFDFSQKFVAPGGPYLRELLWSKEKKLSFNQNLQNFYSFPYLRM